MNTEEYMPCKKRDCSAKLAISCTSGWEGLCLVHKTASGSRGKSIIFNIYDKIKYSGIIFEKVMRCC